MNHNTDQSQPIGHLLWTYRASLLTEPWRGWRHPITIGSDEQNGRHYTTLMLRIPLDRYLIIRLWPFDDPANN